MKVPCPYTHEGVQSAASWFDPGSSSQRRLRPLASPNGGRVNYCHYYYYYYYYYYYCYYYYYDYYYYYYNSYYY